MNRLLRLYPAGFRRDFGEEIAEAYREATQGMGRRVRLREAADVVGHATRLRLGFGSAGRAGRFFAAVTPFALAATGAYAAFALVETAANWYAMGAAGHGAPLVTALNACHLLALVGAVVALAGRYPAGVLCALAGAAGGSLADPLLPTSAALGWNVVALLAVPVLVAALPLCCPPDLRPAGRVRGAPATFALVVWALLLAAVVTVTDPLGAGRLLPWWFGAPAVAALGLAGRSAFVRVHTPARLLGAAAPFIALPYLSGWFQAQDALVSLGALAVVAVALRLRRGNGSGTTAPA
ncbi:hypothetical protein AB0D35_25635 [Streptomyces sp. NPDC048301]|uniref:hypothetical protein n=1 Tax=Streptomyces sp. NPDC048301 TaxID=3155631 RepID=UPI00341666AB